MSTDRLKVVHLTPDFADEHPYILQLVDGLRTLGLEVSSIRSRSFLKEALGLSPDIVHVHWLHSFVETDIDGNGSLACMLRATRLIWQLSVLRRKGVKIVWTVHELNIPETRHHVIDRISVMLVASLSDAVIAHCHGARARIVKTVCPQAPGKVKVVPHGHLVDVTENGATREEARRSLGLDDSAFVVLFFGLIRPYKGVLDLVRAHKQLGLKEVTLLIVGSSVMHHKECVDYMEEIRRAIGSRENVKLIFEFIEDDRIQVVMGASDIVAFPYRDIMTSGALVMAMNFGKPCIAARVGCITETLDERGAYLYERGDQSGLVEVLRRAYLDRDRLPAMGEHNLRLARELPWQTIGQMTMGVYRECFSKRH